MKKFAKALELIYMGPKLAVNLNGFQLGRILKKK
jgi:hypothetical protein